MDQYKVCAESFILKTNIHCQGCEKKVKKLLQHIGGVDKVSIDAEQGKITISGNVDPRMLMELLQKNGKKSELLWEPIMVQKDAKVVRRSKSTMDNHHLIHDKVVEQLQKLSEIKGLKTVEVSSNKMKITFKDDEDVQDLAGKNDYCATNHHCRCSRNQAMYTQYSYGCSLTNCRCMALDRDIPLGIPLYIPSAPPVPEYYPNSPSQEKSYDHPFYTAFSDDNPTGCIMM